MNKAEQNRERYRQGHLGISIVADIAVTYTRMKQLMEAVNGQEAQWTIHPQVQKELEETYNPPYPPSRLYTSLSGNTQRITDGLGGHGGTPGNRLGQYDESDSLLNHELELRQEAFLRDVRQNHGQGAESEYRQVGDRETDRTDFIPAIWCGPTA